MTMKNLSSLPEDLYVSIGGPPGRQEGVYQLVVRQQAVPYAEGVKVVERGDIFEENEVVAAGGDPRAGRVGLAVEHADAEVVPEGFHGAAVLGEVELAGQGGELAHVQDVGADAGGQRAGGGSRGGPGVGGGRVRGAAVG